MMMMRQLEVNYLSTSKLQHPKLFCKRSNSRYRMNTVKQGDTEQQMSDKEADEKDEDVEVCVRQVMQIPQIDRRYWVKLLLPLMTQRARTVINRVTLADKDNFAALKEHQ